MNRVGVLAGRARWSGPPKTLRIATRTHLSIPVRPRAVHGKIGPACIAMGSGRVYALHLMTASDVQHMLSTQANASRAAVLRRFFKTGSGEYGAGDRFLGLTVPQQRRVARQFAALPIAHIQRLLRSRIHEQRLVALVILIRQFERGDHPTRERSIRLYLDNLRHVNNWDLVDLSAPRLLGAWLFDQKRDRLYRLAQSKNLWERRIALLATLHFIRQDEFEDTLALVAQLLADREDLIHKAAGWMLREVGKRHLASLKKFLDQYHPRMPRTMLRYAIERLPAVQRYHYLGRQPARRAVSGTLREFRG